MTHLCIPARRYLALQHDTTLCRLRAYCSVVWLLYVTFTSTVLAEHCCRLPPAFPGRAATALLPTHLGPAGSSRHPYRYCARLPFCTHAAHVPTYVCYYPAQFTTGWRLPTMLPPFPVWTFLRIASAAHHLVPHTHAPRLRVRALLRHSVAATALYCCGTSGLPCPVRAPQFWLDVPALCLRVYACVAVAAYPTARPGSFTAVALLIYWTGSLHTTTPHTGVWLFGCGS